jgi:hypothetical protein
VVAVYAVSVIVGALALVTWVAMSALSARPGSITVDPEERFGVRGRFVVAAALGFGLGGMSAAYAGWPIAGSLAGALGGAALLVGSARWLGVGEDV